MVSSGASNATKLAKVWPARKRASTVAVCFAFCRSSLPANGSGSFFVCIYAARIPEASSVSRGDSGPLHVATVILFSFRWNRPVFPSVSKLNGNHADLGSISRCDKTGRDSIQRYELLQYLSLSLYISLFLELFGLSKYFLDRRNFRPFFRPEIFEIFAKFEDRFARLVRKSCKSKSLGKVSWSSGAQGVRADSHALSLCYAFSFFSNRQFAKAGESSMSRR